MIGCSKMIGNRKVLALIPARGGSKGIKDKNIIDVEGRPLIAYSIEAAAASQYIDRIIVTTDSEKIKIISEKWGAEVPFLRPAEYAADNSTTLAAVLHAIRKLQSEGETFDILVLLQPTSPLRTKEDIDGALEKFIRIGCEALAGISPVADSPVLIRRLNENGRMEKLLQISSTVRRQDMPKYYRINGSIYINNIDEVDENTSFNDNPIPYVMDVEHAVDVDDLKDLEVVKYYLRMRE